MASYLLTAKRGGILHQLLPEALDFFENTSPWVSCEIKCLSCRLVRVETKIGYLSNRPAFFIFSTKLKHLRVLIFFGVIKSLFVSKFETNFGLNTYGSNNILFIRQKCFDENRRKILSLKVSNHTWTALGTVLVTVMNFCLEILLKKFLLIKLRQSNQSRLTNQLFLWWNWLFWSEFEARF